MRSWFIKRKERKLIKQLKLARLIKSYDDSEQKSKHEIKIYHRLANLYGSCIGLKDYPYAQEMQKLAYRKAARLGDVNARLWLCREVLAHAAAKEQWLTDGLFENALHKKDYRDMYAHALVMISKVAEQSLDAHLLLGLCHLNGWGEPKDPMKAYQIIANALEKAEAWHYLPKFISKMKIKGPDLMNQLQRYRLEGVI
jgi:TPR repeat protein